MNDLHDSLSRLLRRRRTLSRAHRPNPSHEGRSQQKTSRFRPVGLCHRAGGAMTGRGILWHALPVAAAALMMLAPAGAQTYRRTGTWLVPPPAGADPHGRQAQNGAFVEIDGVWHSFLLARVPAHAPAGPFLHFLNMNSPAIGLVFTLPPEFVVAGTPFTFKATPVSYHPENPTLQRREDWDQGRHPTFVSLGLNGPGANAYIGYQTQSLTGTIDAYYGLVQQSYETQITITAASRTVDVYMDIRGGHVYHTPTWPSSFLPTSEYKCVARWTYVPVDDPGPGPFSGGRVVAWGRNGSGQGTVPTGLRDVTAVAAGAEHTVALRDGAVAAWGLNDQGQTDVPAGVRDITAIAAGAYHTVALKADGTVFAWGDNEYGQTTVPAGLSGVVAVAAGGWHSVALKGDGTVVAWGRNTWSQTSVPGGLSGVAAVAAAVNHTVALKADGTVVAWGNNFYGQTDVPSGLSGVFSIASTGYHTVALKADGTVRAWGRNEDGQTNVPSGLSGVAAVAAGAYHSVALKVDGRVVAWGSNDDGQIDVPANLRDVFAVAAGGWHTAVLTYSTTPSVAPVVSIKGAKTIRTTKKRVKVRGSASDENGDLAWVKFKDTRPKGARWRNTRGTASWQAVAVLRPKGRNTVQIQAGDSEGLRSRVKMVRILRR